MKISIYYFYFLSILFISSPILLGNSIENSEFIIYPGLILSAFFFLWNKSINYWSILFVFIIVLISIINSSKLVSIGYYSLGIFILLQYHKINHKYLQKIINSLIFFLFFCIALDYLNPNIIDSITTFDRRIMVDNRIDIFSYARPVGFFRESSGLGLFLAVILFYSRFYKLKINYKILILSGILTFTSSFYLGALVTLFLLDKKLFFRPIILISISIFSLLIVAPRFLVFAQDLENLQFDFDQVKYIPLSIIKRFWHPPMALYDFLNINSLSDILFGLGPGNYKELLKNRYSDLIGSDLIDGYVLNILINIFFSFGFFCFLFFSIILKKRYSDLRMFIFVIFVLLQGSPLIHPSTFLLTILPNKSTRFN